MDRPLWYECADLEVLAAADEVWQRLPSEAQRTLAGVKLYSVPHLRNASGQPALGLAKPGGHVYINSTDAPRSSTVLRETIAHEFAHQYLNHMSEMAAAAPGARKALIPRHEAEVNAQLLAWGFEEERRWGRLLIGN